MDWSIQEIARLAGTTSRTLRHYGERGLLEPSRIGSNGYRYYDEDALVRLQRILLLRDLGLGLTAIAEVLRNETDAENALQTHLDWLRRECARLTRQIQSVQTTLNTVKGGEQLMAEDMFDGFNNSQYQAEVEERWGKESYRKGDSWWRSLSDSQKKSFQQTQLDIARDYAQALSEGRSANSDEVQSITARHHEWIALGAGASGVSITKQYFIGLGEMYVADPRFTANYDRYGEGTAAFVSAAMALYAERNLP